MLLWPTILAAVGSLGIPDAATFYAARLRGRVGTLVGTSAALALVQTVVVTGLGVGVVLLLHNDSAAATRRAAFLALAYIPAYLLAMYLMSILNGLHRFTTFQVLRVSVVLGMACALGVLAGLGALTVTAAVVSYVAVHVGVMIAAAVRVAAVGGFPPEFEGAVARKMVGYGIRSHLSSVSSLLNERLDQLLISIFLAPIKLGLYVIAVTLTSLTAIVGTSVSLIALPSIARLEGTAERLRAARHFVAVTLWLSALVSLPMLLLTRPLIVLFFGSGFAPATNVCRVLLVASVLYSTSRALGAVLKGAGRPLDAGIAELVAVGATVAGLAVLLPWLGLMGAAIASLVAYGVSVLWMLRRASRALETPLHTLLVPNRSDLEELRALRWPRSPLFGSGR